jgi:hypothetical protein
MDRKYAFAISAALLVNSAASGAIADQANWMFWLNGETPFDAVVGGHDGNGAPLYICAAWWNGSGPHPGKVVPGLKGCQIGYSFAGPVAQGYGVLVPAYLRATGSSPNAFGNGMAVPPGAITGGYDIDGSTLYHCRAYHNGG